MNKNTYTIVAGICYALLLIFTLFNARLLTVYTDESVYLTNIPRLEQLGFSRQFFLEYNGAAGPLYTFIHYWLKPLTGLQLPYIRYVNIVFLLLVILIINKIGRFFQENNDNIPHLGWFLMAIPTTAISAGLALTELPAMFFLWLSVLLLLKIEQMQTPRNKVIFAFLSAFALSIAIIGRQVYLVTLVGFAYYLIKKQHNFKIISLFLFVAPLLPSLLFYTWGGLLAQHDRAIIEHEYSPFHLSLAFCYAALFIAFIRPQWFIFYKNASFLRFSIAVVFICFLLNWFVLDVHFLPNKALLWKLLPSKSHQDILSNLFGGLTLFLSLYFLMAFSYHLYKNRNNTFYVFCALNFILILGTCLKISHVFGSRYVFQAMPFMLVLLNTDLKIGRKEVFLLLIGFILGFISLYLTR